MTDWLARWQNNKIGWHADTVNRSLVDYFELLELASGASVFVPLCGKSIDMIYLSEMGFSVIGVELSSVGVEQFFVGNGLQYSVSEIDEFVLYRSDRIKIYCGDYFKLTAKHLLSVSAVYDRASLIALDLKLREKYAQHLAAIIPRDVRILLLTLIYPQHQMSGPPFSVSNSEVESLFSSAFKYRQLHCFNDIDNEPKFLRAGVDCVENAAYLLQKGRE
ncbi:MAG TPA: thiopurine S-methyltransferase [Candidatus Thioglobus sp.]|jgi:thiopurine S-methyltransferase|nr:thiopurine S-methyltransferase [Candidatus Thioglobus sp.]HIL20020.1 thiopurine S-methyltransferase [Candidatus Thioglobus sp.]